MGPSIRGELEAAAQLFSDLEVRSRLRRILGTMKKDTITEEPAAPFDTAVLARAKETLLADAGDDIPVRVDGKIYRLPRGRGGADQRRRRTRVLICHAHPGISPAAGVQGVPPRLH